MEKKSSILIWQFFKNRWGGKMIGFEKPLDDSPYDDFFKRYDFEDRMEDFKDK